MESSAQQRPGVRWGLVAEAAEEEQSRCRSAVRTQGMSCVTASASEVDIASPVTLRVEPAGTGELIGSCGNCGSGRRA